MESISKRDNTNTKLASILKLFTFWLFGKFLQTLFIEMCISIDPPFKKSHADSQWYYSFCIIIAIVSVLAMQTEPSKPVHVFLMFIYLEF